jgi:hypothetical protein
MTCACDRARGVLCAYHGLLAAPVHHQDECPDCGADVTLTTCACALERWWALPAREGERRP